MSEWSVYSLGQMGAIVTGKTPSKDNPEDWGTEMPFVTPSDYGTYGKKAYSASRRLSKIGEQRLHVKILPPNSIMVTCIGSDMGKVAMNAVPVITNQQINAIIPKCGSCEPDFLYYKLVSMYETLRAFGGDGTAVPIVNKGDFSNIKSDFPEPIEQKAIAEVLSSLDDKIDLLHRQNKTLESLAETLFRQWFIEGVHDDWEVTKLGDVIDIRDGTHDSPKQTEDGRYLITSRHISKFKVDYAKAYKISELDFDAVSKRSAVDRGDILYSMIGTLGLVHFVYYEPEYAIKNIGLMKTSRSPEYSKYVYLLFSGEVGKQFIFENSQGSTQQYISLGVLRNFEIALPDEPTLKSFNEVVDPLFAKIFRNCEAMEILENLRNALLPKLISGEVCVEYEVAA